ncbi:MAG: hypothetical protein IKM23_08015 [Bacteroidales bacterium]|nr:hypothetical protein [Bacteroidales bacterium]
MKKIFLTILLVLLYTIISFAQNVSVVRSEGVNVNIADYASELINKNISPKMGYNYEFILTQNGDAFSISYNVSPNDIVGEETTDNLWNDIEKTIERALNAIDNQMKNKELLLVQKAQEEKMVKEIEIVKEEIPQQDEVVAESEKENFFTKVKDKYDDVVIQIQDMVTERKQDVVVDDANKTFFYDGIKVYSIDDVKSGITSVGSLVQFSDGTYGVIYYLDGHGSGLAVSLHQTKSKWQNVKDKKDCIDIPLLENVKSFNRQCIVGKGASETSEIVKMQGFVAANWCVARGEGWYLPSVGELYQLLVVANGGNGRNGLISIIMQMFGGEPLGGNAFGGGWYWSSTEENAENAYNISASGGRIATEAKCEEIFVRSVRVL